MKKLSLTLCALAALTAATYAGESTYTNTSSKSMVTAPCPSWYADTEWNVGVSAIYAPTANAYREDTYLGLDHAWGAGVDVKYFFRRYFGVGVQGFGLALNIDDNNFFRRANNNDFAGGLLGTFTFRYPIPCTRIAPYAWVGVGGIFGGGGTRGVPNANGVLTFIDNRGESDGRLMGQYGLGMEYRLTQHFGLTTDVSYNELEGGRNDFFQVRGGLNFAF